MPRHTSRWRGPKSVATRPSRSACGSGRDRTATAELPAPDRRRSGISAQEQERGCPPAWRRSKPRPGRPRLVVADRSGSRCRQNGPIPACASRAPLVQPFAAGRDARDRACRRRVPGCLSTDFRPRDGGQSRATSVPDFRPVPTLSISPLPHGGDHGITRAASRAALDLTASRRLSLGARKPVGPAR
jgi:hypothetical protein